MWSVGVPEDHVPEEEGGAPESGPQVSEIETQEVKVLPRESVLESD